MRQLLLLPLFAPAALSASTPAIPHEPAATPRDYAGMPMCKNRGVQRVDERGGAAVRRLGDLPPADHILTVLRTENGCIDPVIVRHGVGGTGE